MQDKLNANATSGNVNSTSAETLKRIFEAVVGKREYLLELTGGLDASMEIFEGGGMTIRDLLSKAIPFAVLGDSYWSRGLVLRVPSREKILKRSICFKLTNECWKTFSENYGKS
jgi:hypothetical protein